MYVPQESLNNIFKDKKNAVKAFWKSLPIIFTLIVFIMVYIWLCKIIHYAKSEPKNRNKYIIAERLKYYEEGEFCEEKYSDFISKGAYETFDLPIKKIKKWAIAEIVLIPLFLILICIGSSCLRKYIEIFIFLAFIDFVLIIVFGFLFTIDYSDCNFDEFTEFSRCRYLHKRFREDYDHIYSIKDGFQTPLILIIIIEVTSCFASVADF